MLQTQTVVPATFALVKRIFTIPEFKDLRLVGGTALALQLGHRKSVDLDFFGVWDLTLDLVKILAQIGVVEKINKGTRFQFYKVDGVKLDFVTLYCPWLFPAIEEEGLRLADIREIAAMKLSAITNRGRRRDFVDMAELLNHFTMDEMMEWYMRKYPDATPMLTARSLNFFDDAEEDDDIPVMLKKTSWDAVKKRIVEASGSVVRKWISQP